MAHFARVESGIIVEVLVVHDDDAPTEQDAAAYLENLTGHGDWLKTSYNTRGGEHPNDQPFRGNYAGVGFSYDPELDVFLPPRPYPSWHASSNGLWFAPVPRPDIGLWKWDEANQRWVDATP